MSPRSAPPGPSPEPTSPGTRVVCEGCGRVLREARTAPPLRVLFGQCGSCEGAPPRSRPEDHDEDQRRRIG